MSPGPSEVVEEALDYNDRLADRAVALVCLAIMLIDLLWLYSKDINGRGIPSSPAYMSCAMAAVFFSLLVYMFVGSRWWTKYVLLGSQMVNSALVTAGVDYTMMLQMTVPAVSSSIYCRSDLTIGVISIGSALMLAGLLLFNWYSPILFGLYFGMTTVDKIVALLKAVFIVNYMVYLLTCVASFYIARNGIDEIRRWARLRMDKLAFENEVSNAKGIQQGLLIKDFPCGEYCSIASSMDAAKDVGGDFYDCFKVGEDRLAVVMADVSGKGLPASIFMAAAMTLIRSNVRAGGDLAKAMEKANRELVAINSMRYFVTVWIGVIDLRTGGVAYVDAGHNPPYVRKEGTYARLECKPDFVFGRKKKTKYNKQRLSLDVGDGLFLYTDGVTEAMSVDGTLFGDDRLKASLDSAGPSSPEEVLERVKRDVSRFAGGAEQSDDMTLMAVDFVKRFDYEPDKGIRVRADKDGYSAAMSYLRRRMEEGGCPPRTISEMEASCSEVFANIDMHAYADRDSKGDAVVAVDVLDSKVKVTFIDWGVPFNPLEHEDPDPVESFRSRKRGGLGIMMVKRICDDMSYVRDGDRNILKLEKEI